MNKKLLTIAALAGLAPIFNSGATAQDLTAPQQWTYCMSGANSTGEIGVTYLQGSLRYSLNDTWLLSYDCPPETWGVFIMGSTPARYPFGDGFLCINPFDTPLYRLGPPDMSNPLGISQRHLDFTGFPWCWESGSAWYFQCYFRDREASQTGFNLSSGVAATFAP